MKKIALLMLLVLLVSLAGGTLAQDDGTESPNTDTTVTIIPLDGVFVICPPEQLAQVTLERAELVLSFKEDDDVLVVPNGEVVGEEGAQVLVLTEVRLSCASSTDAATLMEVSEPVEINATAPRPTNLDGIVETQTGYGIVNTDNANVRTCDAPECARVAVVDGGTELVVLGRNADDSWWYVQIGDVRGWIWGDLIVLRGDLSDTPVVYTEGEPTPPTAYVGFAGNPLYAEPFYSGGIVCYLPGGVEHLIVGRTSGDTWLELDATCEDGVVRRGWLLGEAAAIRNTGRVYVPITAP